MTDNELDSLQMALEQAANGGRSNADVRACCADANNALSALRARVAELERALNSASKGPESYRSGLSDGRRIARQQCAAIMAVCGYFSRMRGPDAVYEHRQRQDSFPVWVAGVVVNRRMDAGTPLYAGSAPVPAVQAEAKVADETPESVIAAYKAGLTHGREQPDYEFEFASGSASDTAYAIGYNEGYEQRLASATVPQAEAKVPDVMVPPTGSLDHMVQTFANGWNACRDAMLAAKAKGG